MMKKYLIMMFVALGVSFSANAYAADEDIVVFTSTEVAQPSATGSSPQNCSILSQTANLKASDGVFAGFQCNATTLTAVAAACHEGGSTNPLTVTCTCSEADPVGNPGVYDVPNNTQCSCDGTAGGATPLEVEVTGKKAFGGNTNGGSISASPVSEGGTGLCNAANMATLPLFVNNQ